MIIGHSFMRVVVAFRAEEEDARRRRSRGDIFPLSFEMSSGAPFPFDEKISCNIEMSKESNCSLVEIR
jgi:hypothetical protein